MYDAERRRLSRRSKPNLFQLALRLFAVDVPATGELVKTKQLLNPTVPPPAVTPPTSDLQDSLSERTEVVQEIVANRGEGFQVSVKNKGEDIPL